MPHIFINYTKKNPLYGPEFGLVQYAINVNYFYGIAFLLGLLIAIIRENRRINRLVSAEAEAERIAKLRGGADDVLDFETLAYLKLMLNPVSECFPESGYYKHKVLDKELIKVMVSILGNNLERTVSPGVLVMAYAVIKTQSQNRSIRDIALEVLDVREHAVLNFVKKNFPFIFPLLKTHAPRLGSV